MPPFFLRLTLVRPGQACRSGAPCYVVVQTGRLYFKNQEAVARLSRREPWATVRIRGEDVVKVYKLPPGESPFPDGSVEPVPEKHAAQ